MTGNDPELNLPAFHPFTGMDVWRLLASTAAGQPDSTYLIWQPFDAAPVSWTFSQFHADAREIAAGLTAQGVGTGDRVIIHLENCPEFLLAWFACAAIHAIGVTTNVRCSADEFAFFVERWPVTPRRRAGVTGCPGDGSVRRRRR